MPSYSGVWTLTAQLQAKGAGNWPPFLSGDIGLFIGGGTASGYRNIIDYITIASTGNATDFGDTVTVTSRTSSCSNSTRGIISGGFDAGSAAVNTIQYITIASTGNTTDFGDLTTTSTAGAACSSSTRAFIAIGDDVNIINYITIASTGNATDYGDLTVGMSYIGACSNAHGGL